MSVLVDIAIQDNSLQSSETKHCVPLRFSMPPQVYALHHSSASRFIPVQRSMSTHSTPTRSSMPPHAKTPHPSTHLAVTSLQARATQSTPRRHVNADRLSNPMQCDTYLKTLQGSELNRLRPGYEPGAIPHRPPASDYFFFFAASIVQSYRPSPSPRSPAYPWIAP